MLDAPCAHSMQWFDSDDRLAHVVSHFVRDTIDSGCTCVVVPTAEHRAGIEARLAAMGIDADALAAQYRYVALDARATLNAILENGVLHQQRFHQLMNLLVAQVRAGGQPVRIYGEMAGVLAARGDMRAVLRLEELWNELSRQHTFTMYCGYWRPQRPAERHAKLLHAVHSHVLPADY